MIHKFFLFQKLHKSAESEDWERALFFISLFGGLGFGGGIQSNIMVLGAEQFDVRTLECTKQHEKFFLYVESFLFQPQIHDRAFMSL